ISSCLSMAEELIQKVAGQIVPSMKPQPLQSLPRYDISSISFPGLQENVPAIDWCAQHEFCCTLEDYMRRRTNIAQWIAREGLGFRNENREHLGSLARQLPVFNDTTAQNHVDEYCTGVAKRFDQVMAKI
ncbi:MAG: hypothetical protein ACWGN1_00645, partial [Desulfobulbales bacterium]